MIVIVAALPILVATDADAFDRDLQTLGVSAFVAYEPAAGQTFVGRVDYRTPAWVPKTSWWC
jgi:hypothetical protein